MAGGPRVGKHVQGDLLVATFGCAAVVEVNDTMCGVDPGYHHSVVRYWVALVVLAFNGLTPDHFGVEADDDRAAAAQVPLEGLDAGGHAVLRSATLVGNRCADAVVLQQCRKVQPAGPVARIRVLGVGRLDVNRPGVHGAGRGLGHADD